MQFPRRYHAVFWKFTGLLVAAILLCSIDYWIKPDSIASPRGRWISSAFSARSHDTSQPASQPSIHWQLEAQGAIPMPAGMPVAHASSLLVMPAHHPAAVTIFWFSGDRESAPNVEIAMSQYLRATQQWTPARLIVNRFAVGAQLGWGIRRLGNPIPWIDGQGRIHLFVVATGAGGWAASRILHLRQTDTNNPELQLEPLGVLPLSWLWNTSFLVRNAPLPLEDGGMMLPVYFEIGIKYPAALRFDAAGNFSGMVRLSQRKHFLQPTFVMRSATEWLAFLRDGHHGKIGVARTTDAGAHWQDAPSLTLDNPDAAVASLSLAPDYMLLLHNSSLGSRQVLDWSASHNGEDWHLVQNLARGGQGDEFSYPALAWSDSDQRLWISYTMNRKHIAWQRFSR